MRALIWLLSLFVLLVVQAGILIPFHLAPVNLLLIMIVVATLLEDFNFSLTLTLTAGLLLDFVSGSPDGLVTMSVLGVFLILYFILHTLLAREPNRLILYSSVAAATVIYFALFFVLNQVFALLHLGTPLGGSYVASVELPLMILFNLLFAYPIFQYFSVTQKWATHFKPTI